MRRSALAALVLSTAAAAFFYVYLLGLFPPETTADGALAAAMLAAVFAGVFGLVYLIVADLEPRDIAEAAERVSAQVVSRLFRWDRTIRAVLLMATIHLPFLMVGLLFMFAGKPFQWTLLAVVPGAWIAAFTGGFILGTEEPEAPFRTIEIGQAILNVGMLGLVVLTDVCGADIDSLAAAKILGTRLLTYGALCAAGAFVGARSRAAAEARRA